MTKQGRRPKDSPTMTTPWFVIQGFGFMSGARRPARPPAAFCRQRSGGRAFWKTIPRKDPQRSGQCALKGEVAPRLQVSALQIFARVGLAAGTDSPLRSLNRRSWIRRKIAAMGQSGRRRGSLIRQILSGGQMREVGADARLCRLGGPGHLPQAGTENIAVACRGPSSAAPPGTLAFGAGGRLCINRFAPAENGRRTGGGRVADWPTRWRSAGSTRPSCPS